MKAPHLNVLAVVAALAVGAVASPIASRAFIFRQEVPQQEASAQYQRALQDQARVRVQRRQYWQAIDVFRTLQQMGIENIDAPKISDAKSYLHYLDDDYVESLKQTTHASADDDVVQLEYDDLPESERDLLDGYTLTKLCPEYLKRYHVEGFYDLCLRLVDERIAIENAAGSGRAEPYHPEDELRLLRRRLDAIGDALDKDTINFTEGLSPRRR